VVYSLQIIAQKKRHILSKVWGAPQVTPPSKQVPRIQTLPNDDPPPHHIREQNTLPMRLRANAIMDQMFRDGGKGMSAD
jgi:hypothetical protein